MKTCWIAIAALGLAAGASSSAQTTHYLDCAAGSDAADSLTPQTAWRTIAQANGYLFQPGDSLLLRRGVRCEGMLSPKGSGTSQAPIHIGAYGKGALPIIAGGSQPAAIQLHNQQYWEMENLEVIGGSPYGIHIGGTEPMLNHFRITNVMVHDVTGEPLTKDSGLVVIAPDPKSKTLINDVIVNGVTAFSTSEWAGIIVNGASFDSADDSVHGEHIAVRNSIVHDVAGDGILLARVAHGVIEHNVAWNTGMQDTETIGTPNAIWQWMCADCRVAYNEGYFSDSPGVDGGVFDIDYGDSDNIVEENFGHDSQGYCVAVFGAEGAGGNSTRNTIRRNTCIHNGRSPRLARRQGAMFMTTWHGGRLNGINIEDNIILWEPPLDAPALQSTAEFFGDLPNRFARNTVLAASGSLASVKSGIVVEQNRYCKPENSMNTKTAAPGASSGANKMDDLCSCIYEWQTSVMGESAAMPPQVSEVSARTETNVARGILAAQHGHWTLLAFLAPEGAPEAAASRSESVVLESMMHQFADRGLQGIAVPLLALAPDELEQWRRDWNFDPQVLTDSGHSLALRKAYDPSAIPQLLLLDPSGQAIAHWRNPISPASVWLWLQSRLGVPPGAQAIPACKPS